MKPSIFKAENGKTYLFPFVIVAALFFLSGYTNALLDVLNKYFQDVLHISRAASGLVQFSLYAGYFVMAIPAGLFINKYGYNKSLILGLLILLSGTILFIPGAYIQSYYIFLIALFIIACGFSFFEIIANPYATFLGNENAATRRINLAQAFNGIGWVFGPLLGGLIIFNNTGSAHFNNLPIPFIILGIGVLIILLIIIRKPLPELAEIRQVEASTAIPINPKPFYKYPHFIFAVVAQFFYVAAQTGINSFFINYVTETDTNISNKTASLMLAFGGMVLFVSGRFLGSYLMKFIKPEKMLSICSMASVLLVALVITKVHGVSIIALCGVYFFMSIMYPTIFALGIKGLGAEVKKASSYMIMAIIGGALCPMLMGKIADGYSMTAGFTVPLMCFFLIFIFAVKGCKLK